MKRNNTYADDERKKTLGKRLSEVMELKGKERSEVRQVLGSEYSYPIDRQTYYKYEKGVNWMAPDFVDKVSALLEINKGYLLGDDNLTCDSYPEYESIKELNSLKNSEEYFRIFKHTGLLLSADNGDFFIDGKRHKSSDPTYTLTRITKKGNIRKEFSEKEMLTYYESILRFINKYFDDFDPESVDSLKGGDTLD